MNWKEKSRRHPFWLVDNPRYERFHRRLILARYGTPLDKFSKRRELLFAYHDALQGVSRGDVYIHVVTVRLAHHRMYSVAGILHRDIKPGNILIYPDGKEGNRGVLIYYDHAIRITDTSPYSTKRKIVREEFSSNLVLLIQYIYATPEHILIFVTQRPERHRASNISARPGIVLLCLCLSHIVKRRKTRTRI